MAPARAEMRDLMKSRPSGNASVSRAPSMACGRHSRSRGLTTGVARSTTSAHLAFSTARSGRSAFALDCAGCSEAETAEFDRAETIDALHDALERRLDDLERQGIPRERVVLDPGADQKRGGVALHGQLPGHDVVIDRLQGDRGEDAVAVTNFGDGASSQGAVSEAFNFAAVFCAPVVFVLENNGWAISVPVTKQCGVKELARRGPGFGIPSIRVDGNDILAMIVATQKAVEHARAGNGPYLIEAVTYRMSLHTTADDPKVYRKDEQVKAWEAKDPIRRFEIYLKNKGVLDDADFDRIAEECEKQVLEAREAFRARAKAKPREVFDFMYEQLPPELQEQQREYFAKLDRKGVE
jgi:hypothetical protein